MTDRRHHPADARVGAKQAAAAAGGEIVGRKRIAFELGKSERQVSRLISAGKLVATRAAGWPNKPLAVRLGKVR